MNHCQPLLTIVNHELTIDKHNFSPLVNHDYPVINHQLTMFDNY